MQAGVCVRQDTETALPELTEQHRIRLKEEELSGVESVHMAESETDCAAPGLNTLKPECVTAHSGVSDVHHTHTSLIKTESDLGSTHTGDFIKTETLDSTELGYVTHLHPDQIKTEADDGKYLKTEHVRDLQDITCVCIKSDEIKCETNENLESDLMNTVTTGAGVDHIDQNEPWQCAGETNPNCKKEKIHDLLTHCGELNQHCDINNENNQTRIAQESANRSKKHIHYQRRYVRIEPKVVDSSKDTSRLNLFQNKLKNKGEIDPREKPFRCTQCGKCFSANSALNTHLRIHRGEKPYECSDCGKCFASTSHLNSHQRIHTGEKPYKCAYCGKCFPSVSNLNSHKIIHTGERPYKCPHCEKCFSQVSYLSRHQRIHTGEKPFECIQCGKCFSQSSTLNVHKKIHTGEKPHSCFQCGKCFSKISHLNTHQRIHTGEKPYKCTLCAKSFNTKSYLETHLRIHRGEKPYKCTQCEKCFIANSSLNIHLRIHTGEKPYKCTLCEKCFASVSALNIHLRIHSGEKPYKSTR